jgi:hypothetical protein
MASSFIKKQTLRGLKALNNSRRSSHKTRLTQPVRGSSIFTKNLLQSPCPEQNQLECRNVDLLKTPSWPQLTSCIIPVPKQKVCLSSPFKKWPSGRNRSWVAQRLCVRTCLNLLLKMAAKLHHGKCSGSKQRSLPVQTGRHMMMHLSELQEPAMMAAPALRKALQALASCPSCCSQLTRQM